MRTIELLEDIAFRESSPHAESLHSNDEGRALRFAFLPEQRLAAHNAPHSPIHLIIIQGRGMFTGADGIERECSEGMMVVFDSGEEHSVRALDEKLVFISIYKENPAALKYDSPHRKKLEAEPQHHEHNEVGSAEIPQE